MQYGFARVRRTWDCGLHRAQPPEWVYPCSTRKGNDNVSGPLWQCWPKRYIVCTQIHTRTHTYSRTEPYFHNLSRAVGSGLVVVVGWWRRAWGWHVSANNHITHRDPHSNFLMTPPPTHPVSLGYRPAFSSPNRSWWNCAGMGQGYVVGILGLEKQNYSWKCLEKYKMEKKLIW